MRGCVRGVRLAERMERVEIPSVSFADFGRPFMEDVTRQRVPLNVIFELTYRCNFDCVHCYVVQETAPDELETAEDKASFVEMLHTLDVPASAIHNPTCVGALSRREPLAVNEWAPRRRAEPTP